MAKYSAKCKETVGAECCWAKQKQTAEVEKALSLGQWPCQPVGIHRDPISTLNPETMQNHTEEQKTPHPKKNNNENSQPSDSETCLVSLWSLASFPPRKMEIGLRQEEIHTVGHELYMPYALRTGTSFVYICLNFDCLLFPPLQVPHLYVCPLHALWHASMWSVSLESPHQVQGQPAVLELKCWQRQLADELFHSQDSHIRYCLRLHRRRHPPALPPVCLMNLSSIRHRYPGTGCWE